MERDSFFCALQRETAPIFKKILSHPFVVGIGDGTLPEDKFCFYIKQDYLFLIEYSRVLALAAAKAQSLNTMEKFAALLHSTLNVEMDLHRQYAKEFGISRQELQRAEIAPTVRAYTDYLLQTAFSGSLGEIVASITPCGWGYYEIATHLSGRGKPAHPLYRQWIEMYASQEFGALAYWLRDLLDQEGLQAGEEKRKMMINKFIFSAKYEYLFWEMAYTDQRWSI
ncbi:thiaminase II [Candidatus Acetothermia bacterium]|jgi:thiaminase/transcriptional activator TenA|nr:thiaminase II [Candidatus Acetothermia bacterium]MCI2426940.1 thiaminase II [Candidatus Acetothermia bacterium]MCI2428638.1 thiaminase II [Candidatus Acetothermia bacterium]